MKAINTKVRRDLWKLKTQLAAIALVIGCGVAMIVLAWSMLASLRLTQESYYERYRFADVFAVLKRAPSTLTTRLAGIPGVAQVQTRVVQDVTLDLPDLNEPAIARLISLADQPSDGLNLLHVREGRFPATHSADEVLVTEGFAQAHRIRPGDSLFAVLRGKRQRLSIVGIALSPEYVYQIRGGEIMPNDRTFGIFWMSKEALATACDMEGAFNDVVLRLSPGASEFDVIERLDRLLDSYGGVGAVSREFQTSNRFVTNELRELRNMGYFAPVIFLVVAAFLGDDFRVEARVTVAHLDDVVKTPNGAVFRQRDEPAVFVVVAGRARVRPITLGRRNRLEAEVSGGLSAGEHVILYPGDKVHEGVRVSVRH